MNKIKISKELAAAIESAASLYSKTPINNQSELINIFDKIVENTMKKRWSEKRGILNETPLKDLCEMLINGYEVEETPDDRILRVWMSKNPLNENDLSWRMWAHFVLSELKYKVEGINK